MLAIRGEPDIGKTALLGYAAKTAPELRVARAEGAESEMELPFAGAAPVLRPKCWIAWKRCRARSATPGTIP